MQKFLNVIKFDSFWTQTWECKPSLGLAQTQQTFEVYICLDFVPN